MANELTHHGILGMKWGVRRYQNKDGTLTEAGKKRKSHTQSVEPHDKKSVKSMSDAELRNRLNRLQMEKQYGDLTKKKNRGKKAVQKFISTAGTISAAVAAYKKYKGLSDEAVDKIGDWVIKGIDWSGVNRY